MEPLRTIIVGGGHRSLTYAHLSELEPQNMKIVGIADPDENRRKSISQRFGIGPEHCFESAQKLAEVPKFADAVINGTMDEVHVETTLPLLKAGYDVLLEKPFAVNEAEARELVAAADKYGRKIMVCFVLRYAPFYQKIKQMLMDKTIGDVIDIETTEYVSYDHMSIGYVRGKWNNSNKCHSSMLLAKSCHDVDIMMWLMNDTRPKTVTSLGGLKQYVPSNAPANAGTRCVVDCPLVNECIYSAKRLYLDHPDRWSFYVWDKLENMDHPTLEDKRKLLETSQYGICIYKGDNNVVDHQTLSVMFENGATGTHRMIGGSVRDNRLIAITGTKGTITGNLEDGKLTLKMINPDPGCQYDTEEIDFASGDSHGGGDLGLVRDFVKYCRGEETSPSCTSIDDSLAGHLCVYLADKSCEENGMPQVFRF